MCSLSNRNGLPYTSQDLQCEIRAQHFCVPERGLSSSLEMVTFLLPSHRHGEWENLCSLCNGMSDLVSWNFSDLLQGNFSNYPAKMICLQWKAWPWTFYSLMLMSLSFHVVMCLKLSGWKIPVCFLVWRESIHHGPLSVLLQDSPEHRQLSHWWGTLKSLHNLAKGQEGVGRR